MDAFTLFFTQHLPPGSWWWRDPSRRRLQNRVASPKAHGNHLKTAGLSRQATDHLPTLWTCLDNNGLKGLWMGFVHICWPPIAIDQRLIYNRTICGLWIPGSQKHKLYNVTAPPNVTSVKVLWAGGGRIIQFPLYMLDLDRPIRPISIHQHHPPAIIPGGLLRSPHYRSDPAALRMPWWRFGARPCSVPSAVHTFSQSPRGSPEPEGKGSWVRGYMVGIGHMLATKTPVVYWFGL